MRYISVVAILAALLVGCARAGDVVSPSTRNDLGQTPAAENQGPYRLWGEWTWYINADHTRVDVVPNRYGRFHLNTLKFLESYCTDCLEITNIHNNGDGTIDLGVKITHPFDNLPQYTGFDVKGIVMFNASHEVPWESELIFPQQNPVWVSWRVKGDPEVLNADGYTPRWSPWWETGSDLPMFNYWPGKYSKGTPTGVVNAFLNFYTDEERHMFRVNKSVERVYHIWLPGGPVVAGYAVEACWEPPLVSPVTDPASDFPISANQPEPYYFRYVVNGGNIITEAPCCGKPDDCSTLWIESHTWIDFGKWHGFGRLPGWAKYISYDVGIDYMCPAESPAPKPDSYGPWPMLEVFTDAFPDGTYRGVACLYPYPQGIYWTDTVAYDVFDFTINLE